MDRQAKQIEVADRLSKLRAMALLVAALLFAKTLLTILYEYRWYFPANFESSAFLSGRRGSFFGIYRAAFYVHIISGPLAIVLGMMLMISGGRSRHRVAHRRIGRSQILIVLAAVAPSGLVMAQQAYAGPIAAWGFAAHSIATAGCATATALHARARKFQSHRKWASRCFILLCSPLLLRLISGATIVTQTESDWTYRLNAWLSWLIPLVIYEAWWRRSAREVSPSPVKQNLYAANQRGFP